MEQSDVIIGMTSDRVEDRYVDPQLNTGGEGIDEFQRTKKGDIRNSNVWLVERHSQWERRLTVLVRVKVLDKNVIPFLYDLQTTLEAEAGKSMECLLFGTHQFISQVM